MATTITPTPVDDVLLAFPAQIDHLMPPMEDIPEEFTDGDNPWIRFQTDWFASGLSGETELAPQPGIDVEVAIRHLSAIQGSFQPQHEHKVAAVAYLASEWFRGVRYSTLSAPDQFRTAGTMPEDS